MAQATFPTKSESLERALLYMQCALQLLDDADAPAEIGAHLDLAICRLQLIAPDAAAGARSQTTPAHEEPVAAKRRP